jgi:L-amino acid N-acyltransferase YncA
VNTRVAERSDLEAIVAIYNEAVARRATADMDPLTVEDRLAWFEAHAPESRPILVAEAESEILGWLSLGDYRAGRRAVRHTAEVSYYVGSRHHRRGVASRLLEDCIARCPGLEIKTLFAILLDNNEGSVALLQKFGFERWGHLPSVADFDGDEVGHFYYGRRVE